MCFAFPHIAMCVVPTANVEVNNSKEGAAPAPQGTFLTKESVPTNGYALEEVRSQASNSPDSGATELFARNKKADSNYIQIANRHEQSNRCLPQIEGRSWSCHIHG